MSDAGFLEIPIDEHDLRESRVRTYCRAFPAVFARAKDEHLFDASGRKWIDFFSGAGAVNYGHNNERIRGALVDYLAADGVVHALDMLTEAKKEFMERFERAILRPRGLEYKMQFTGPAGTNAIETSLKIARLAKRRSNIVAFTRGYHGLTLGALAITANAHFRNEVFVNRHDATFAPYDGYCGEGFDTLAYFRQLLEDPSSGLDLPAAVVVETVQAEGGVNVAGIPWLRGLAAICREFDICLIVDDIQVGCGRTGSFFSFERAGIEPDIVALSKSISGLGLPMSVVLMKPELDTWQRGEETATFRGHNLAFVTAAAALSYWETEDLARSVAAKGRLAAELLEGIRARHPELPIRARGLGLIHGLDLGDARLAQATAREAFQRGLVIELCGPTDAVLKVLPPLTIAEASLREGLGILESALDAALADRRVFES